MTKKSQGILEAISNCPAIVYLNAVLGTFKARYIIPVSLIITVLVLQANYLIVAKTCEDGVIPDSIVASVICLLIIIALVISIRADLLSRLVSKMINHIDMWILIVFLVALECSILELFVFQMRNEAFAIALRTVFITSSILLIWRMMYLNYKRTKSLKNQPTVGRVFDLKTLLENPEEIIKTGRTPFYLKDEEVDYDLLGRDDEIGEILTAIKSCGINEHINIAVKGEWGSGKSTLLRNVKRKLYEEKSNVLFIDDFEPWEYQGEDDILVAAYNAILRNIDSNLDLGDIKRLVNSYVPMFQKMLGIAMPELRVGDIRQARK